MIVPDLCYHELPGGCRKVVGEAEEPGDVATLSYCDEPLADHDLISHAFDPSRCGHEESEHKKLKTYWPVEIGGQGEQVLDVCWGCHEHPASSRLRPHYMVHPFTRTPEPSPESAGEDG